MNSSIRANENEKKNELARVCHLFLYASKYSFKTCKPQTNFKDFSCPLIYKPVLTLEYVCACSRAYKNSSLLQY